MRYFYSPENIRTAILWLSLAFYHVECRRKHKTRARKSKKRTSANQLGGRASYDHRVYVGKYLAIDVAWQY